MVGYWLARHVVVACAVGATSTRPLGYVLASQALPGVVQCLGSASVGVLTGWLMVAAPYGLIGLVVPLLGLRTAVGQEVRRATEVRLLAELTRSQQQRSGRSVDQAAEVVVTAAARVFGGADVEMLLRGGPSPVRYLGNEYGVPERRAVDATAFDDAWVRRTLGRSGVCLGLDSDQPYCSVQISPAGRLVGVVIARRPAGSAPFSRRDAALAGVLAERAATWLSIGEPGPGGPVDGPFGEAQREPATDSALVVVNSAAGRLARLTAAASSPDRVVDILTELYAVERGVACLTGTLAPAGPVPARLTPVAGGPAAEPLRAPTATDWTTSGVLPGPRGG